MEIEEEYRKEIEELRAIFVSEEIKPFIELLESNIKAESDIRNHPVDPSILLYKKGYADAITWLRGVITQYQDADV